MTKVSVELRTASLNDLSEVVRWNRATMNA